MLPISYKLYHTRAFLRFTCLRKNYSVTVIDGDDQHTKFCW